MRVFLASVSLLLASSAGIAATPLAPPAPPSAAPTAAPAAPAALADERLDLARRFVALRDQDHEFISLVRQGFWSGAMPFVTAITDDGKRATAIDQMTALFAKLEPTIRKRIPAVSEVYARAYAAKFSTDELKELVAFGSTPTGKNFLSNMLTIEADPSVSAAAMGVMEELTPALMEFQKQACIQHTQQRIAMGDKKATCPLSTADETREL